MIIDWSPEGWRVYLTPADKEKQNLLKLIPEHDLTLRGPVVLHNNGSRGWIEVNNDEI